MGSRPAGTPSAAVRLRRWVRSQVRYALWRVWPGSPTTWSQLPARLASAAISIVRLTVAAVVAYLVASALAPAGTIDLTAPLTALLVVQASAVGTLRMGLVRVGAVLTGVLVAVGVAVSLGLSWWSLALVVAASLVLARVLRLGEQSLEAPISAMLILAVSAPALAAEVRVGLTLVGTAVGIVFSLLLPVSIPNRRATDAVRRVARSQASLLNEVALTLGAGAPHAEEVAAWTQWTDAIDAEIADASAAITVVEESRTLNARALTTAEVHPGLRSVLDRLDRCLEAERLLLTAVAQAAPTSRARPDQPAAAELHRAFAVVLDDLANGLRALAEVTDAEFGERGGRRLDDAVASLVEIVRETRAVLTELVLLDVDPRDNADLWLLQGSLLASVDRILALLDLEHPPRQPAEPRLRLPRLPDLPRLRRGRG